MADKVTQIGGEYLKVVDLGDQSGALATYLKGGTVALTAGTTNIGDVDVLTLPGTVIAGMASLPTGTLTIGNTKDAGPSWTTVWGVGGQRVQGTAAGTVAITDAPAGTAQHLVVTDVLLSANAAMELTLQEETSGTAIAGIFLPANGSAQLTFRSKLRLPTAGKKLNMVLGAAGTVDATTFYYSED